MSRRDPQASPVVVVGAGVAGLATALTLAPAPVVLVSRSKLGVDLASAWAQGGIAAALDAEDSPALHAIDTHTAGDGLCVAEAVDAVTRAGPEVIRQLEAWGARFDRDAAGRIALGREGGHGRHRIAHVRDATGAAVTDALVTAARATSSITILEGVEAEDLLLDEGRVVGLAARRGAERLVLAARAVVLATGGIGGLYARTSNPLGARGDGLALAARVGARLMDLEFVQFHPTAIDVGRDPMPLATEALRGEGAVLINDAGERFMLGQHALAELAPRDIVARGIWRERAAGRRVFLDAREALGTAFPDRFPTVLAACQQSGIDPRVAPIPVAPAAHYHMGGLETAADGATSLAGLWAVGECACTGLHGANRLASNSLLEAVVYGVAAANTISGLPAAVARPHAPPGFLRETAAAKAPDAMAALRQCMEAGVGVLRRRESLAAALATLVRLRREAEAAGLRAVANGATVGLMIAASAIGREESRGAHCREDFPARAANARHSTMTLAQAEAVATAVAGSPIG